MLSRLLPSLLLLTLSIISPIVGAAANDSGKTLMRQMLMAISERSFEGSFLYARGPDIQLFNIVHRNQNGVEQERIWNTNGEPLEMVRENGELTCYHIQNTNIPLSHTIPTGPFAQMMRSHFEEGLVNYNIQKVGMDRVANHAAQVIMVMPFDQQRYSYRLWLDQNSHLLLRSEIVDLNGSVLEQFQFVSVTIDTALTDQDFLVSDAEHRISHNESLSSQMAMASQTRIQPNLWQPSWVPDGYLIKNANSSTLANKPMDRSMYSDGLSSFSLFVEPADGSMPSGVKRFGATVAIVKQIGDHTVTLVGEIPVSTGQKILSSIKAPKTSR